MSRFYNHLNSVSGTLLAKKYINARTLSATHVDEFAALSTNVPDETLTLWASKICAWEVDREQPNPYFNPSSGTLNCTFIVTPFDSSLGPSELEIRRHLTLEEERDELDSAALNSSDNFTETKYLLYGLDLEDQ